MSRILIAEDDLVSRRMLKVTLEKFGHEVIAASDGTEAWDLLMQPDAPQLVILDWMMPGKDGPEIVAGLRASEIEQYHYVILLTSKSEKEDITHGWESGADDFITKPFDREELALRLHAGERMIALENNLAAKNSELGVANEQISAANARMKDELQAAAKTQAALLPTKQPENDRVKFSWQYVPCEELAGDILNFFKLDNDNIGMYVLDVSGHGVASALLSVTVNRFLTPQQRQSTMLCDYDPETGTYKIHSPSKVLQALNHHFPMDIQTGQYFTIVYGVLNTVTMDFSFSSAGHPPLIIARNGDGAEAVQCAGLPVGFDEHAEYSDVALKLQPGNRLYFYSDGMNETKNASREEFGVPNLVKNVDAFQKYALIESIEKLIEKVAEWNYNPKFDDDITLLSLEII